MNEQANTSPKHMRCKEFPQNIKQHERKFARANKKKLPCIYCMHECQRTIVLRLEMVLHVAYIALFWPNVIASV